MDVALAAGVGVGAAAIAIASHDLFRAAMDPMGRSTVLVAVPVLYALCAGVALIRVSGCRPAALMLMAMVAGATVGGWIVGDRYDWTNGAYGTQTLNGSGFYPITYGAMYFVLASIGATVGGLTASAWQSRRG